MRLAILAGIVTLAASSVSAEIAEGPTRTFGARDLFGLQAASDPQVRPDGGAVAYVRVANDILMMAIGTRLIAGAVADLSSLQP